MRVSLGHDAQADWRIRQKMNAADHPHRSAIRRIRNIESSNLDQQFASIEAVTEREPLIKAVHHQKTVHQKKCNEIDLAD